MAILSLSSLLLLSSSDNLLLSSSRYNDNLRGVFMWLRAEEMWLRGEVMWLRGDVIVASISSSHPVDLSAVRTFSVETAISGMLLQLVGVVTINRCKAALPCSQRSNNQVIVDIMVVLSTQHFH